MCILCTSMDRLAVWLVSLWLYSIINLRQCLDVTLQLFVMLKWKRLQSILERKLTQELNENWSNCMIGLWFHNSCVLTLWGPLFQYRKLGSTIAHIMTCNLNDIISILIYQLFRRHIQCSSLILPVLSAHSVSYASS